MIEWVARRSRSKSRTSPSSSTRRWRISSERAAGALTCVDGVAFAPHRRVDVAALGVDFYLASLYKVYGPHLSVMFGRRELLLRATSSNHFFLTDGPAPAKFEPGNVNFELAASLVGIVDYMYTPYDNGASGMEYRILFNPRKPGGRSNIRYMVRTEPGAFDSLFTGLEEQLMTVNRDRIISTEGLMEIKRRGIIMNQVIVKILSGISVLLLFVTSVG